MVKLLRHWRVALLYLAAFVAGACSGSASAQDTAKYNRPVYVVKPEPGVHCYVVLDGAPLVAAISCVDRRSDSEW